VGGALIVGGFVAWLAMVLWQPWRRRETWAAFQMPTRPTEVTPIAQAANAGTVACAGQVVASDEVFESPSGKIVVWYECVIRIQSDADEGANAAPPLVLRKASAFEIDDGSGARLRVIPQGGYLLPDAHSSDRELAKGNLLERLKDVLLRNGRQAETTDLHGITIAESSLALHDRAVVQGAVRPARPRTYRESGSAHRELCAGDDTLWVWAPARWDDLSPRSR
jgi:hypothetical protein